MYLDKLEIHGFKSFGDAVKLNIPKGITGVIGPNGSGKSNVSDAIRWVLGEQSAKSLRGSKMEDIIFAGTEKRKSLGYAEVALTIKNPTETVRIAYSEIIVKRRVYRSGESEYFINGSTCRLKDVQELFMDTGIGKDGYSIIGQGQIDRVLSSKPEERRTLFEEAAGIYKYKVRRQEAEKKLEKQRDNLTRLQDIIGEIEHRLEPLEREAEKTVQFLQLKEQLKETDINIFIFEITRLEKEIHELTQKISNTEEEISDKNTEYQKHLKDIEDLKAERSKVYEDIEGLIEAIATLEKEHERKQSLITINKEKKLNIERLIEQVEQDKQDQLMVHQTKCDKLALLETKKVGLEIEHASKVTIIEQEEAKLSHLVEALLKLEGNIDHSKEELFQKMREVDLLAAEVEKNDSVGEQLEYRMIQIKEQIALLNSEIQHQEVSLRLIEKRQRDGQEALNQLEDEFETTTKQKEVLTREEDKIKNQLNMKMQQLSEAQRQYKWLEHLKNEHEGYFGSVKQVLNVAKTDKARWQGIVGIVGELLDVPKLYETAVVIALGGAIQNIVTKTETDAKQMISLMKQKGISRVTFFPMDTIKGSNRIQESNLANEAGFLGFASELIKYDNAYTNIVSSLLGRILIIDNMENASRIAKRYQYKYKLVTLEGEVFNSGGSLSGGSVKNQTNNIFSRSRELKELGLKVASLTKEVDDLKRNSERLAESLIEVATHYNEQGEKINQLKDQLKHEAVENEKTTHMLKMTKNNQLQLINERSGIDETLEKIQQGKEVVKEKHGLLKAGIAGEQEAIATLENQLVQAKSDREIAEQALTQKRISLSSTSQNLTYISEQIKELTVDIEGQGEKSIQIEEVTQKYREEMDELSKNSEHAKLEIESILVQIKEKQNARISLDEKKVSIEAKEKQFLETQNKVNEQIDLLKEEKYRLDTKKQNSNLQKQNWGNSMWEQYELTYHNALVYQKDDISISEYKKYSVELRSKIKAIGSVNVNAVEEFKETKERYEFLTHQQEDIQKAEATLVAMIEELLEQMKEIFEVQFSIIAENFSKVFKELFGGGEAYLKLLDEENILESGIEIIAKPPGKKLQNMTLLSGGERTLTAISLIFGILQLKPSPFCVLDEIEAALDDANVLRFADYLERLSTETQFIVITHRKGTMERAHTLYGVTMQERGVSTILSIQLEEVNKYIDDKKTS